MKKIILITTILLLTQPLFSQVENIDTANKAAGQIIAEGNKSRKITRIISLMPSITEIIFALGQGHNLKGVTNWCNYPKETETITNKLGYGRTGFDVETIVNLNPDIVFLRETEPNLSIRIEYKNSDIRIINLPDTTSIEDVYAQIKTIARELRVREEGKKLIEKIKTEIDKVPQKSSRFKTVFIEVDTCWSAGTKSFISDLVKRAGGNNLLNSEHYKTANAKGYGKISTELLSESPPNIVLKLHKQPLCPALKNKEFLLIEAEGAAFDFVSRDGPRIGQAAQWLHNKFYAE